MGQCFTGITKTFRWSLFTAAMCRACSTSTPIRGQRPAIRTAEPPMTLSAHPLRGESFLDIVLEETVRRRRGHEAAVQFSGDAAVLHDVAAGKLHLQRLTRWFVAHRTDLRGIHSLTVHGVPLGRARGKPDRTRLQRGETATRETACQRRQAMVEARNNGRRGRWPWLRCCRTTKLDGKPPDRNPMPHATTLALVRRTGAHRAKSLLISDWNPSRMQVRSQASGKHLYALS